MRRKFAERFTSLSDPAFKAAMESKTVNDIAGGKLDIDAVAGMSDVQAQASFHMIRWPDTNGHPKCPKCRCTKVYSMEARSKWKCAECGTQFSLTSKTLFSSPKMPLRTYLFGLSVVTNADNILNVSEFGREMKVNYRTAWDLTSKLKSIIKNENGCTTPFALMTRLAWHENQQSIRKALRETNVGDLVYPYLTSNNKKLEGAELIMFANELVPRGLPDYVRSDICQDMIVAILAGEMSENEIKNDKKKFITKVLSDSPWKYRWMSFDAPVGREHGIRTLHDVLAVPNAFENEDDFEETWK